MHRVRVDEALELLTVRGLYVRDVGLLDSALARPVASAFGQPAYGSLALAAAAQTESLARNHPLVDGNKRAAVYLLFVFLRLNGCRLEATGDELFTYILDVAQGKRDLESSAEFIAEHLVAWQPRQSAAEIARLTGTAVER